MPQRTQCTLTGGAALACAMRTCRYCCPKNLTVHSAYIQDVEPQDVLGVRIEPAAHMNTMSGRGLAAAGLRLTPWLSIPTAGLRVVLQHFRGRRHLHRHRRELRYGQGSNALVPAAAAQLQLGGRLERRRTTAPQCRLHRVLPPTEHCPRGPFLLRAIFAALLSKSAARFCCAGRTSPSKFTRSPIAASFRPRWPSQIWRSGT